MNQQFIHKRRGIADCRLERGEGRLKTVLVLVVVAIFVFAAIKIVPIYVNDYELSDSMQEQARFAVVNRYTEDQIRENVYKKIIDLGIPAKKEDIKVIATNSVVRISLDYTVPLDLLAYHTELHFSTNSEGKSVL
ncbi:MAG TPA: hypothetical protein VMH48_11585 [Methylomirabilota bacterium]|nr:hypothetical protein [Methylomirabilota bacterium]